MFLTQPFFPSPYILLLLVLYLPEKKREVKKEVPEEAKQTFTYAVLKIYNALAYGNTGDMIRWITDLLIYASYYGYDKYFLDVFKRILDDVSTKPEHFQMRFARYLNSRLNDMITKPEGAIVGKLALKAADIKEKKFKEYIIPSKKIKEQVDSIINEVFKK